MNKEDAKKFLPLVEALAKGKTIQHKNLISNTWHDVAQVSSSGDPDRYRVKPERIKKKMWYRPGDKTDALYPVSDSTLTHQNWTKNGWKIVEVEFDAP